MAQRTRQFSRLLTSTSVLLSVFIGILTIVIAFWFQFDDSLKSNDLKNVSVKDAFLSILSNLSLAFIIFIILILVTTLLGRYFFRRLTPEYYAEYSIEGYTYSDSFSYIAYNIWKICQRVQSFDRVFQVINQVISHDGEIERIDKLNTEKAIKKLNYEIDYFDNRMIKKHVRIQWTDSMIVALGKEMKIPARRLSDYLFHFSPDIFTHELRTTIYEIRELLITCRNSENGSLQRRNELAQKINRFYKKIQERQALQKKLIEYKDLHLTFIALSSSGYGLSNAFGSYCMGLQEISQQANTGKQKDDIKIAKKLLFFYHKRKLYHGFDLHALLLNYSYQQHVIKKNQERLDHLNKLTKLRTKNINNENYPDCTRVRLPNIKNDIDDYLFNQRSIEARRLFDLVIERLLEKQSKSKIKKLIFVTQGYSGVVNSCLRDFATYVEKLLSEENTEEKDKQYIPILKRTKIFFYILLSPEEVDNEHKSVSRYVLYKFKDNPDISRLGDGKRVKVKLGDINWLKNRFTNDDNCIRFLLSGAEFVQIKKQGEKDLTTVYQSRFINNEGIYGFLNHDLNCLGEHETIFNKYEHIIMAEDFKYFKYKLDIDYIKKAFNSEYLEYINLYPWDENRTILLPSLELKQSKERCIIFPAEHYYSVKEQSKMKEYFQSFFS